MRIYTRNPVSVVSYLHKIRDNPLRFLRIITQCLPFQMPFKHPDKTDERLNDLIYKQRNPITIVSLRFKSKPGIRQFLFILPPLPDQSESAV